MNELRWILLILGIVLIVGLYAWGMRSRSRSGVAADARKPAVFTGTADSFEQEQAPFDDTPPVESRRVEPSMSIGSAEPTRAARGGDRAPAASTRTEANDGSARREPTWSTRGDMTAGHQPGARAGDRRIEPSFGAAPHIARRSEPDHALTDEWTHEQLDEVDADGWQTGQNEQDEQDEQDEQGDASSERAGEFSRARDPEPPEEARPAPGSGQVRDAEREAAQPEAVKPARPQQKIIAMRVNAVPPARLDGARLKESLLAEGLEFGRYDIFHRLHSDGRPVFSVASLREPGTFDLQAMATSAYPGVALFAVLPGPVAAAETLDEMIFTARALAQQLGGALADERGAPLTPLRIGRLREDALDFERGSGPA
jgi:cell division protein ZipA